MVKFGPPSPKVNTLDVDEEWTYAATATETWQIIKFFLEELKQVDHEKLDPEDRKCHICGEDFTNELHRAVRLPCNHTFGESCIKKWLSPYATCMPVIWKSWRKPVGSNTCPTCRRVLFPAQKTADILPIIESRIKLWDEAYAYVGIALSDRERQAREDLLRYLAGYFARGMDYYYPCDTATSGYPAYARVLFRTSTNLLRGKTLSPVQEQLRQGLEEIVRLGFPDHPNWLHHTRGQLNHQLEVTETMESGKDDEEVEVEEESEELAEGDTEEMRFFRTMLR